MKKILALLLVLCTLVGLVACGKKEPASTNSSTPTTGNSTSDPTGTTEDPHLTVTPETSPYNGKTLEIYGIGTAVSYTNYDSFGKGNYLWMEKAAIEEWAAINGVKIEWKGTYNQNGILASIQSGDHPDLIFQSNQFPAISNVGLTAELTDAEYEKLAAICGNVYLDMLKYKGKATGFVYPWTGTYMCYYNKTMFENYGVKTPKEYFMEGTWNWENFTKCAVEMTKDIDSDGDIDTYGVNNDSMYALVNTWKQDETGKLISTIDEPWIQDYIRLKYDMYAVKKIVQNPGANQIQKNVTYPMCAMQISDCEPYNFEHMYQSIANGDELEVVPIPEWRGENGETLGMSRLTQSAVYMASSCDEREAAVDLLAYLLKCGLKYISDFSLGAVKCDYVGMQGKCDLSKKWMEAFKKVCEDRAAAVKEIENYDEELVAKINTYLVGEGLAVNYNVSKVAVLSGYAEIINLPPASSIPIIKQKYQAALDAYNDTYIK